VRFKNGRPAAASSSGGKYSGKIDSIDVTRSPMSDTDDLLPKVQEAFKATFDIDPHLVTIESTADDIPEWDSVGHLSLGANLEEVFGVSLDVDDLMEMETVRKIVNVISLKLTEKV
jgi:acyl carrier protein